LWDVATGRNCAASRCRVRFHHVAFSPDGKQALSGGDSVVIQLWDVATGREVRRFEGHTNRVTGMAFSPDGTFVSPAARTRPSASGTRPPPRRSGASRGTGNGSLLRGVSPDGRRILSGSNDRTVRLWDVETGKELRVFEGHTDHVVSVAFSPDGRRGSPPPRTGRCACGTSRPARNCARSRGTSNFVTSAVFSPDGRRVLSGSYDNTVRLWDARPARSCTASQAIRTGSARRRFSDGRYALSGRRQDVAAVAAAEMKEGP